MERNPVIGMKKPTFLYRHDHPNGALIDAADPTVDMDRLDAEGWVDSPDKILTPEQIAQKEALHALRKMTVKQLEAYAADANIQVVKGLHKDELIGRIERAIHMGDEDVTGSEGDPTVQYGGDNGKDGFIIESADELRAKQKAQ